MKKSIKYLYEEKQEDLKYFVSMVLERIPHTQMIILYDSYATGKYVEFNTRIDFSICTIYMSDYDILVVTDQTKDKEVDQKLDNIKEIYYKNPEKQTTVQFINDNIKKLNKNLSDGRYFYPQLKEEGVILYNTRKFKLVRRRKLRYDEISQQTQEYFNEKFTNANGFLKVTKFCYKEEDYKLASFQLHQACENLFYAVCLVFTLENSKQHNLSKLLAPVRKYSDEFEKIFLCKTEGEKRLFTLLKSPYVEARYNSNLHISKENINTLMPIIE